MSTMQFPFNEICGIVNDVFPENIQTFVGNLDDVNSCLDVAVEPFDTIRITASQIGGLWIKIERFKIEYWNNNKCVVRRIWQGDIPANDKSEPDFDFIEKILRNYKSF